MFHVSMLKDSTEETTKKQGSGVIFGLFLVFGFVAFMAISNRD